MKDLFLKSAILQKTISKLVGFNMNLLSSEIIDANAESLLGKPSLKYLEQYYKFRV